MPTPPNENLTDGNDICFRFDQFRKDSLLGTT